MKLTPAERATLARIGDTRRKAAEHRVELGSTPRNDGVRLSCACGWWRLLGLNATPEEAMELTADHRYRSAPAAAWAAGEVK